MTRYAKETMRKNAEHLKLLYPEQFPGIKAARMLMLVGGTASLLAVFALWRLDFSLMRIINGMERLSDFIVLMFPPSSGGNWERYLWAMGETLSIAFLGTLVAAILAFPFGFLAAKNVIPNPFAHFGVRRLLDSIRGIDVLIWALIWVNVVGLGPFAGVLAVICSDFGAFGKLFSEAIENTDRKTTDAVIASGGGKLQTQRFAILPQVLPVIGSQILYYFESNTRSATIIGIVGAGGIGTYLTDHIRVLNLPEAAFLILMVLALVTAIDVLSSKLRFILIGKKGAI